MDLVGILKLAVRWWFLTILLVAATLAAAIVTQRDAPREYEASGFLQLMPPELDASRNPLFLVNLTDLAEESRDDQVRADLAAVGASNPFDVRLISLGQIDVEVSGDPRQAPETAAVVLDYLEGQVLEEIRQSDSALADDFSISTSVITLTEDLGIDEDQEIDEAQVSAIGRLTFDDPTALVENPFGANDATAAVLKAAAESDVGNQRITAAMGDPDNLVEYSIEPEGGPGIIAVTFVGRTPDSAIEGFFIVKDVLEQELTLRQNRANVPSLRRLELDALAEPLEVEDRTGPLSRAAAAVVVLGGSLTLLVLLGANSLENRRRVDEHAPTLRASRASTDKGEEKGALGATPPNGSSQRLRQSPESDGEDLISPTPSTGISGQDPRTRGQAP